VCFLALRVLSLSGGRVRTHAPAVAASVGRLLCLCLFVKACRCAQAAQALRSEKESVRSAVRGCARQKPNKQTNKHFNEQA
jgi:hypothetical protein